MPKVLNVCTSSKKGVQKTPVEFVKVIKSRGIEGDAHAGDWHRQVSLLADEAASTIREKGVSIKPGDFGENILTSGIDLPLLKVGTCLKIKDVLLKVTQIGKKCHDRCAIYEKAGTCVMPKEGIFCEVLEGGEIKPDDVIQVVP